MSKYPIYYGDQVIAGGSTLENAQEIVQELIADGAFLEDELVIAIPEEPAVAEDDWELGPACGLDPEVCESCQ